MSEFTEMWRVKHDEPLNYNERIVNNACEIIERQDERIEEFEERIEALEQLLVCYRVGKNPSEALHRKLEKTKQALKGKSTESELEEAAKKCARTGNRKDLQEYLKLRRNYL